MDLFFRGTKILHLLIYMQHKHKAVLYFGWTQWTELLSAIALFLISLATSRFMMVAVVFPSPSPSSTGQVSFYAYRHSPPPPQIVY